MLPTNSLVPVDDVDALAKKMTLLMAKPESFLFDFDEQFLPKNIAQKYIDYLNSSWVYLILVIESFEKYRRNYC